MHSDLFGAIRSWECLKYFMIMIIFQGEFGGASKNKMCTNGLRLLDASYIKSLIAIGDSTLVIKLTLKTSSPSDGKLARIVKQIQKEVRRFESIEYYRHE